MMICDQGERDRELNTNNIPFPLIDRSSVLPTFSPASIGVRSANGTSLVAISHKVTAKLHMSAALTFSSLGFFWRAVRKGNKEMKIESREKI